MTYTSNSHYHRHRNCTAGLLPGIGSDFVRRSESPATLEKMGYKPCPDCYPERVGE